MDGIFCFFIATSLAINVLGFAFTALDTGFSIDSDAIMANHEGLSPKAWRERWVGASRAFGVWLGAFLQDCLERVIRKVCLDLHHAYHLCRLVGLKEVDLIEVVDVAVLDVVSEKMVHGVLTDRTRTHQPKRIGLRHALHWDKECRH